MFDCQSITVMSDQKLNGIKEMIFPLYPGGFFSGTKIIIANILVLL